jgi:hypothetical protein
MNEFNQRHRAATPSTSNGRTRGDLANGNDERPSAYAAMLQAPLTVLSDNVSDRADVRGIAILGYN